MKTDMISDKWRLALVRAALFSLTTLVNNSLAGRKTGQVGIVRSHLRKF